MIKETKQYGFVYAVRPQGYNWVKIGFSTNPRKRIGGLASWWVRDGVIDATCPLVIMMLMPGTKSTEQEVHDRFPHLRLRWGRNSEFFVLTPELQEYLELNHKVFGLLSNHPAVPTFDSDRLVWGSALWKSAS